MKFLPLVFLITALAAEEPFVVDDNKLILSFENGVGSLADSKEHITADDLAKALKDAPQSVAGLKLPDASPGDPATGVYMIGTVYKCGKCDREGKTYPIVEILAADKAADIAIFRVKADDLSPLALGTPAEIGAEVRVISHPDRRFFMQTSGEVSRYHRQPARKDKAAAVWMNITADYAKGSSGGPVIDEAGKVVGMVSSTQSIYYESNNGQPKGALQMVVKNCVPASAIRALLK